MQGMPEVNDSENHDDIKLRTFCPELFFMISLNFRMWFKYGLKVQKLLAQGSALGMMAISKTPCKGKSLMFCLEC